jgi:hypothetical protein
MTPLRKLLLCGCLVADWLRQPRRSYSEASHELHRVNGMTQCGHSTCALYSKPIGNNYLR